jgi:hypothetical protein
LEIPGKEQNKSPNSTSVLSPAERGICPVLWRVNVNFKAFDFSFLNYNCIFPRMYETKHKA